MGAAPGLRLMVFDRTCRGRGLLPGLTFSWEVGGALYQSWGRLDAFHGVESWGEALDWLLQVEPARPIQEIQYWGHGQWGRVLVQRDVLDLTALIPGHPLHHKLTRLRDRLSGPEALIWLRTCATFGKPEGHELACALTEFFGCRAAGHTYVIGPWQSGLHSLRPGQRPGWSTTEGVQDDPAVRQARWSTWRAPNTISCLTGHIPAGY